MKVKIRRTWGPLRPTQRVHNKGKKTGYDRQKEKKHWKTNKTQE